MQILSDDSMKMERHCFAFLNLFNFKFQNLWDMRDNVAHTNVEEEEGTEGIRGGLV